MPHSVQGFNLRQFHTENSVRRLLSLKFRRFRGENRQFPLSISDRMDNVKVADIRPPNRSPCSVP
jgi:hypothetical protein